MTGAAVETLSPHEYLEHLQKEFGDAIPPFAADVADVLTASLIASLPEAHRKASERIALSRRAKLREKFWSQLPESARALATLAEKMFDGFADTLDSADRENSSPLETSSSTAGLRATRVRLEPDRSRAKARKPASAARGKRVDKRRSP